MAQFWESNLTMTFENNSDDAESAIKAELEQVYIMASYVDAGRGRLEIVKHLVSAAIDELESLMGEPPDLLSPSVRHAGAGSLTGHNAQRG